MIEQTIKAQDIKLPVAGAPEHAGYLLREARESQGLHLGALAVALKVPVKKLEALEAGKYEQLPDIVFVRALTLSVCRALKIDPTQIMAVLPLSNASPFKRREPSLQTVFDESGRSSFGTVWFHLLSPIGLGVLLLLLAMLAILLWPMQNNTESASSSVNAPNQNVAPAQDSNALSASLPGTLTVPSADQLAAAPNALPTSGAVTTINAPTYSASATGSANPVAAPVSTAQPSILGFTAHGVTWIEVTDATGDLKLRKLTTDGEVISVSGQLPLSVIVGRADQVAVTVRGKPLDIMPLAKENVVRFDVK